MIGNQLSKWSAIECVCWRGAQFNSGEWMLMEVIVWQIPQEVTLYLAQQGTPFNKNNTCV